MSAPFLVSMRTPVSIQVWVAQLSWWIWKSPAEAANKLPHQMPSLYQSLLWGFSPVGAMAPL
jgi:hypothetical protein